MAHTLGRYTLEERIGSGGMAEVWLASGPYGRCVVKVPHRHLCDNAEFVRMFLDEASLLAQLHHPNIAQIHDLGQADGTYYLAMEYVPGFDLMTISLEHERHGELMSPELCARIVADAASALHYAHEAKDAKGNPLHLIHRDVTPHNILLSRQGVVKLIDFGVARASSTRHRTQAGFVKGKCPYMAPEQITGQLIDRRVDVYALGLVLYELLTNVRAIAGDNELEQIDAARAGRVRPIEQLRPNVPVPLRQILGGCLHFEVEGRYPTALAVQEDLEKFLALERHVLGQDDLLRLFRVVAADVGGLPPDVDARPTEQEQPSPAQGPVVLPSRPDANIDELGYSSTQPSLKLPAFKPEPLALTASKIVPAVTAPEVPRPSKTPALALGVSSVAIIGLAVALWAPWKTDVAPVVDAGGPVVVVPPAPEPALEPDAGVEPEVVQAVVINVTAFTEADVFVDGERYGRTPIELQLLAGRHRIVVSDKARGFERVVTWTLEPGETRALHVAAPAGRGTIKIDAAPYCLMRVDGKPIGDKAVSFVEVEASEGRHTVQCTLEDASLPKPRVKKKVVKVIAGERAEASFNMLVD